MKLLNLLLCVCLTAGISLAQAPSRSALLSGVPIAAQGEKPVVRFPAIRAEPLPDTAVPKLAADTWYIIEADVKCLVLASSTSGGEVRISAHDGPFHALGKFIDSNGKVEVRNYTAKHIWAIWPEKSGRVEILVVLPNAETEEDILRKTIDVNTGQAPQPPPVDPPPPQPPVDPPTPPGPVNPPGPVDPPDVEPEPEGAVNVLVVYDTESPLTGPQNLVINGTRVRKYARDNSVGFRAWDDATDTSGESAAWQGMLATANEHLKKPGSKFKKPVIYVFKGTDGKPYNLGARADDPNALKDEQAVIDAVRARLPTTP